MQIANELSQPNSKSALTVGGETLARNREKNVILSSRLMLEGIGFPSLGELGTDDDRETLEKYSIGSILEKGHVPDFGPEKFQVYRKPYLRSGALSLLGLARSGSRLAGELLAGIAPALGLWN